MKYNSKYYPNKYNRQTKSSLYIPKDQDIALEVPIYLKIPYYDDDEEFFIVTATNPGLVSKYKTYVYDANVEHFKKNKDIIKIGIPKGKYNTLSGGSSIHYSTMWTIKFTEPDIIYNIKNTKSLSHKVLTKYIDNIIDDVEYTKIVLTMDKIND